MKRIFSNLNPPQGNECMEVCDSTSLMETTGYESLPKTVDRLMIAGFNLYQANRNGEYQGDNADNVDGQLPAVSKYVDAKDVMMRMREIQQRLKRKVNAVSNTPAEENEVTPSSDTGITTVGEESAESSANEGS